MPVAAFFSLLWFCPHELPCGHSFASGSWELANATFAVNVVEPLALEMRGPPLRPLIPKQDICEAVPGPGIKEELIAVLHRAEQLLESQLSNVLRDFRQVGSDGQVPKRNAWFWNHSDERALKCALRSRSLLEASSILRRCAGKLQCWDEGPPLVNLGMTCHLHSSLAECNQLLAGDLEVPGDLEQAEASDTEEDIDISQACTSRGIPAKIIAKSKFLDIEVCLAQAFPLIDSRPCVCSEALFEFIVEDLQLLFAHQIYPNPSTAVSSRFPIRPTLSLERLAGCPVPGAMLKQTLQQK